MKRMIFALLFLVPQIIACNKSETKSAAATSAAAQPGGKFAPNTPAPAFEYPDLTGKKRSLKDFEGKTVLLNFWATWCVPCVAEMASLERLYKTYKDKGFEIVAVNVDPAESQADVEKFIKDNGITFTILRDTELALPPVYELSGFPETFFIGKKGQFLKFNDPLESSTDVRVVGDRAWDSQNFLKAVADVLAADS